MHPEVRQKGPGSCPICGMALEPVNVTLEEQPNEELDDMTRRFWWSLALTVPILRSWSPRFCPGSRCSARVDARRAELDRVRARDAGRALGRLAVLRARLGVDRQPAPQHVHADRARRRRGVRLQRGRDARARTCFRDSFRMDGAVAVYFEPAAVIVVLVLLGQVLELRARSRTSAAIRNLLGLAPKTARRVEADGAEHDVPLEHVHVGDRLRVRPGERVPVDGVVDRGRDQRRRVDGDRRADSGREDARRDAVTGGTVNGTGTFVMEAQRVGTDTLLAQIVRMVSEAQRSRAPIQRLADTVSAWFVPAVIARRGRRRSSSGRSSGPSRGSRMRSSMRLPC